MSDKSTTEIRRNAPAAPRTTALTIVSTVGDDEQRTGIDGRGSQREPLAGILRSIATHVTAHPMGRSLSRAAGQRRNRPMLLLHSRPLLSAAHSYINPLLRAAAKSPITPRYIYINSPSTMPESKVLSVEDLQTSDAKSVQSPAATLPDPVHSDRPCVSAKSDG